MTSDEACDRLAINELLNTYTWAMYDRDWDTWQTVFTEDAQVDYSTAGGIVGTPAEAAEWLANTFTMFDLAAAQLTNVSIHFDGPDLARVRSMYKMSMRIPGDPPTYMEAHGAYRDSVRRTAAGWRIADRYEQLFSIR